MRRTQSWFLMGIAGTPVQVRNLDATGVKTHYGPFMASALPVAGFAVIEAASLDEVIEKVSHVPAPSRMASLKCGRWNT